MWTCPKCERVFKKKSQPHSCRKVSIESHFENKEIAKEIFDYLVSMVNKEIGKCQIVSIPCCIHLFGSFDFLASLPKKDRLEIRFGLNRKLDSPRLKQAVPTSTRGYKNCIDVSRKEEIDAELIGWTSEAYHLNDKKL